MNQDKLNELNGLSIEELESLITASSKAIALKKSKEANTIRKKVSELLQEEVLEHTEVQAKKSTPKAIPKTVPKVTPPKPLASNIKYQDPNNPARTWTGRGRMPLWMMEAIHAGADKESFICKD